MKISVNKDEELAKEIRQKIKDNGGYCICKFDKIDENKCMCKDFLTSNELGYCHCGLYNKEEL